MDKKKLEAFKKRLETRQQELRRAVTRTQQDGRSADEDTAQDIADKASAIPSAFIVNMNDDTLNAFQALETLKADARLKTIPILAFANHEEVDTFNRARALGVNKIVSRNEFSTRLKELIEEVAGDHA